MDGVENDVDWVARSETGRDKVAWCGGAWQHHVVGWPRTEGRGVDDDVRNGTVRSVMVWSCRMWTCAVWDEMVWFIDTA